MNKDKSKKKILEPGRAKRLRAAFQRWPFGCEVTIKVERFRRLEGLAEEYRLR